MRDAVSQIVGKPITPHSIAQHLRLAQDRVEAVLSEPPYPTKGRWVFKYKWKA